MDEKIKKTILTGLGLLSLTKKEIEKAVTDVSKKHGLKTSEGEKLAREMIKKMETKNKELADRFESAVAKAMKAMNIPTRKEIDDLNKKVDSLNRKIGKK